MITDSSGKVLFSEAELACKHCGKVKLHPGFAEELKGLRVELNEAMSLTSACRCKIHNANVGGHPNSLHVLDEAQHPGQDGTLAVDVAAADGAYRGRLFALAWKRGWSIGWNAKQKFLHLDKRVMIGLQQTTFDY